MSLRVADVLAHMNAFAPPGMAAEWDNTGLLLGTADAECRGVMTCLTLTPDVAAEAIEAGVSLVVSHHPILFRGVKRLTADTSEGRMVLALAAAKVAVSSPHTSFDNCPGGINDGLAARMGLANITPLRRKEYGKVFKLAVFTPEADLAAVCEAMFAAGAGQIGNYKECSFRTAGLGTFHGDDSTHPTVGVKNRREEAPEWRLEVIVPEAKLNAVIAAMTAAHSYEVPAFDVYPLKTVTLGGEGRVGDLPVPVALPNLIEDLKLRLNSRAMQAVIATTKPVRRVAVACGAAGEFLPDAIRAGADVFVTGELRFHDALTARDAGVRVIIPGHYATERPGVEDLAMRLATAFAPCPVFASRREQDPLANWI
jgi:dinuclear metal center YbgI/SA1388 family protein